MEIGKRYKEWRAGHGYMVLVHYAHTTDKPMSPPDPEFR
jgi:hypothetical protein